MKLLHSSPTSERAAHPPAAPVGHLEHTGRPQNKQWSLPSGTSDFSVEVKQSLVDMHLFHKNNT